MDETGFRDEVRSLLRDMPITIVDMNERQMLGCILYTLYEMNKHLKHLDAKVTKLQLGRTEKT